MDDEGMMMRRRRKRKRRKRRMGPLCCTHCETGDDGMQYCRAIGVIITCID